MPTDREFKIKIDRSIAALILMIATALDQCCAGPHAPGHPAALAVHAKKAHAGPRAPRHPIRSHYAGPQQRRTGSSGGKRTRSGRPDLIRPPVFLYKWPETYRPEFPSPDGKYVFRLTVEEAEAHRVDILPRASHHPPILASVGDGNAVWAPHRPHTLVVAGSGMYGPALLAYWNGGRRLKTLLPIKSNFNDFLAIVGVSKDGRKVYYSMTPAYPTASKGGNLAKEERVYVVRLPRGA